MQEHVDEVDVPVGLEALALAAPIEAEYGGPHVQQQWTQLGGLLRVRVRVRVRDGVRVGVRVRLGLG